MWKWGVCSSRPQRFKARSRGGCGDDSHSAETSPHPVCIVRKLSDCHDSIPTGYELIWTYNNTAVLLEEEPPHSYCCYSASEEPTVKAFQRSSETVFKQPRVDLCLFTCWTRLRIYVGNYPTLSNRRRNHSNKRTRLTLNKKGKTQLRGYHSAPMIIKSLQVPSLSPRSLISTGSIQRWNVNDDESPWRLDGDEGLISLSLGEQATDDYRSQSSTAWLLRAFINDSSSALHRTTLLFAYLCSHWSDTGVDLLVGFFHLVTSATTFLSFFLCFVGFLQVFRFSLAR